MKKWMYYTLIAVFATVFLVSAVTLGVYFWNSHKEQGRYQELSTLHPEPSVRPVPVDPETDETQIPVELAYTEVTDPKTGESWEILTEFAQLYNMNSDIVGWLKIPGTKIDYPVMHTPEDPEYYLKRNFDKKSSSQGCLFLQAECDALAPTDNVVIYGHHMRDGTMFGELDKYRKAAFREENPYIYFDSLYQLQTYEVMAVFLTTATAGEGFAYHAFIDAKDEAQYDAFVEQCKALSLYDTGVEAQFGDKLICLSTCEYSQTNGRLVIVAKQVA